MDVIALLILVVGGFIAFDVVAWRFGADSREQLRDRGR